MSHKLVSLIIILVAIGLVFFIYPTAWNQGADYINSKFKLEGKIFSIPHFTDAVPFRLGLDLLGGTHLVYQADVGSIAEQDPDEAMAGVRDVIERRVNLFGVAEPIVQIEGKNRLVVELAGIKDVNQAIDQIGLTPFLEFKEQRTEEETNAIEGAQKKGDRIREDAYFKPTGLTGKHLTQSQLVFDQNTYEPQVSLLLNDEGKSLFADITERNVKKMLAIYLDGQAISIAEVREVIPNGQAIISGRFSIQEARDLTNRLNAGALPVPIKLISQQTIGASLGQDSLQKSLQAGLYGLMLVAVFMILYYRLPGLVSVIALLVYTAIVLAVYKLVPVTITLAGIAGFILSLGIAVDANILIFARMREEIKLGKTLNQSLNEGFRRAWLSIRDSHITTLLGASVLYIFTTSFVKGFALTLGIGVLTSLFTAIIVTRYFLNFFIKSWFEKRKWLF